MIKYVNLIDVLTHNLNETTIIGQLKLKFFVMKLKIVPTFKKTFNLTCRKSQIESKKLSN